MAPGWILKEMGAFFTQEKKKKNCQKRTCSGVEGNEMPS